MVLPISAAMTMVARPLAIYYDDEAQGVIVMQFFTPHIVLRYLLMAGFKHDGMAQVWGRYCAGTLFRVSDQSMKTVDRKMDVRLYAESWRILPKRWCFRTRILGQGAITPSLTGPWPACVRMWT